MTEWNCSTAARPTWSGNQLRLALDPARGLTEVTRLSDGAALTQILGVEIVDAVGLGSRALIEEGATPEVMCRQDIAMVVYKPTAARPVECHARWRIHDEGVFDLEVSTLTPGRWDGLSVRTCTVLPPGETLSLDNAPVVLHRLGAWSYVEMCHPHDTIGFEVESTGVLHFRLFGHDLEKGVILRGRLRGTLLEGAGGVDQAREAFRRFLQEPPHLSV